MSCNFNIMELAKEYNLKRIMVKKRSWGFGSYCIVHRVDFNKDKIYGSAFGLIHYSNGTYKYGKIDCSGCYNWGLIKVFDDDLEINYKE